MYNWGPWQNSGIRSSGSTSSLRGCNCACSASFAAARQGASWRLGSSRYTIGINNWVESCAISSWLKMNNYLDLSVTTKGINTVHSGIIYEFDRLTRTTNTITTRNIGLFSLNYSQVILEYVRSYSVLSIALLNSLIRFSTARMISLKW